MDKQPPESESKASPSKKAKPAASSAKAKPPSSSKKAETVSPADSSSKARSATSSAKAINKANPASDYAIVEASGQQFWLQQDRYYDLDRLKEDLNAIITLDKVLLIKDSKGTTVGSPYIKGASVKVKVMEHRRGPKLIVYKMRPKKKTRRKNGHRQELTRVMVQSISSK